MLLNLDFLDRVSVLVVGDVMLDRYIWGDIRRISPEAPVPVLEIERESHTAGGAANVALNLAALGVRCELFGIIGNDPAGMELQTLLQERKVAFDARLARKSTPTITKTRIVAQRQQLCRLDKESPPRHYSVTEAGLLGLLVERAASYDAVVMSDYAKGMISQPVVDGLRQVRTKQRGFLALDPKPSRALEISGMDLLTPNRSEAMQLAGIDPHDREFPENSEIADRIIERHRPECLVMTLSEHGMLLRQRLGTAKHFPTVARQVADVSGAGDTVTATLCAAMASGLSAADAVHIANIAARVVVGKLGTATLTREELLTAALT
jgi:D-beta-D-heptose 7-phosphate kinase/D-beta-D-heptose 1-phosphate adenosyltransferase